MKTCCDYECAEANNCQFGGVQCEYCHGYFCANELGEYNGMFVCDDCKAEMKAEEQEGEEDEQK